MESVIIISNKIKKKNKNLDSLYKWDNSENNIDSKDQQNWIENRDFDKSNENIVMQRIHKNSSQNNVIWEQNELNKLKIDDKQRREVIDILKSNSKILMHSEQNIHIKDSNL